MYSLVIPVYKNEESLPDLINELNKLVGPYPEKSFEVVFVVDGSPDGSYLYLKNALPVAQFQSQLIHLSRNYGSFAATRAGMDAACGPLYAITAADLQEPLTLVASMFDVLEKDEADVVIGVRESREDPWLQKVAALLYWRAYRLFIQPAIPAGGVDVFGCNELFCRQLLSLKESHSSLIGLIFWLGFRRAYIPYIRSKRPYGKSSWTFRTKRKYLMDSVFSFTDLPIKMLIRVGLVGLLTSAVFSLLVIYSKFWGELTVPGYAATVILILFFTGLNSLGLGLLGSYIWRIYENTKNRPDSIIMNTEHFPQA